MTCSGALRDNLGYPEVVSLNMQKDGSDGENFLFGEFRIDRERQTGLVGDRPAQDMEAGLDAQSKPVAISGCLQSSVFGSNRNNFRDRG
jgi:hypothetical protein